MSASEFFGRNWFGQSARFSSISLDPNSDDRKKSAYANIFMVNMGIVIDMKAKICFVVHTDLWHLP